MNGQLGPGALWTDRLLEAGAVTVGVLTHVVEQAGPAPARKVHMFLQQVCNPAKGQFSAGRLHMSKRIPHDAPFQTLGRRHLSTSLNSGSICAPPPRLV